MPRETVKQRQERLTWALGEIARVTAIPADKRSDLDWLRAACSLAHTYATAGRTPPPENVDESAEAPPPAPEKPSNRPQDPQKHP